MNNKDLLRTAALNETLDKEQIRKNAIASANRVVVLRKAVATAACTLLMAGICLSVALLNPPKTDVIKVEQTSVESTIESTNKTKKTKKKHAVKKTYKTTAKTKATTKKDNLIPWTDSTESTHKTLYMEPVTGILPSTHYQEQNSTTAFVPSDDQITKELIYEVHTTYIAITGYEGEGDTVVIPSQIDGKPVTAIRESFNEKNTIKYVWIPSSVTHIDPATFIIGSDVVIQTPIDSYAYKYAEIGNMNGIFLK